MTKKPWNESRALNHFASWAFFWVCAFVAVIALAIGRWWTMAWTGIIAIGLWRGLTSRAYAKRLEGDQPNLRL
jgi:hypothetical protein